MLISLYHHLGLPLIPCDFTFSFSRLKPSPSPEGSGNSSHTKAAATHTAETYFIHTGSSGLSFPSLPSQAFTSPLSFLYHTAHFILFALAYLLYLSICFLVYHSVLPRSRPFSSYISTLRTRLDHPIPLLPLPSTRIGTAFSSFAHSIVVPLFSAVGTMSTADVLDMPMGIMADYVHTTVGTRHWRLSADTGAEEVARRLVRPVAEQGKGYVRLGTEVRGLEVVQKGGGVKIVLDEKGEDVQVDMVVLATPASIAEQLLGGLLKSARSRGVEGEEMDRLIMAREALKAVRHAVRPFSSWLGSTSGPCATEMQQAVPDRGLVGARQLIDRKQSSSHTATLQSSPPRSTISAI